MSKVFSSFPVIIASCCECYNFLGLFFRVINFLDKHTGYRFGLVYCKQEGFIDISSKLLKWYIFLLWQSYAIKSDNFANLRTFQVLIFMVLASFISVSKTKKLIRNLRWIVKLFEKLFNVQRALRVKLWMETFWTLWGRSLMTSTTSFGKEKKIR